jgi:acetolactate synthase-1/2/3 large subunit
MAKASDTLVAALENEGVERIFGIPGEENLDFVESLRTLEDRIGARAPRASRGIYGRYARASDGQPGVCLSTLGPGALNFTTGAAHALLGAMPMVMITGQKAIKSARQARFQIVDTVAAMRPLTKMTRQSVSAASIPTVVREAFRVASELLKRERRAGRTKPFEANESTISASRSENAASGR